MTQYRNNGISFNPGKCAFCVNSKVLLGHIVCEDGLLVDLRKITSPHICFDECDTFKNIYRGSKFLLTVFQEFCY